MRRPFRSYLLHSKQTLYRLIPSLYNNMDLSDASEGCRRMLTAFSHKGDKDGLCQPD